VGQNDGGFVLKLPNKFHIDRLFESLSNLSKNNSLHMNDTLFQLYGILYEIGSKWDYYQDFFLMEEE
jgi:hypothetical protein